MVCWWISGLVREEAKDEGADAILSVVIDARGADGEAVAAEPETCIDGEGVVIIGEVAGNFSNHDIGDVFAGLPIGGGVESFGHLVIPIEAIARPLYGVSMDEDAPIAAQAAIDLVHEAEFDGITAFVAFGLILPNTDQADFSIEVNIDGCPIGIAGNGIFARDDIVLAAATGEGLCGDKPHIEVGSVDDVDLFVDACGEIAKHRDLAASDHDIDLGMALDKAACLFSASEVGTKIHGVEGGGAFIPIAVFAEGGFAAMERLEAFADGHIGAQESAIGFFFFGVSIDAFVGIEDGFEGVILSNSGHDADIDEQNEHGDGDIHEGKVSGAHLAAEER